MKKTILVIATFLSLVALSASFAQGTVAGNPDATKIGIDTAQQKLREVSIEKFENPGFWEVYLSSDDGHIESRLFEGSPSGNDGEAIPDERSAGINPAIADKFVLGLRADFFRRGVNEISITAKKPLPIEGITKTISVWVIGRNYNHKLYIVLQDFFGNPFELPLGTLNFQGWKKLVVAVPPQSPDGKGGIIQRNYHYNQNMGIKIVGFKIRCEPMEAYGSFYFYMDDLRATTDLFAEDNRDPDDMNDALFP